MTSMQILRWIRPDCAINPWPAVSREGLAFLTRKDWFPDASPPRFGVVALTWGTIVSSSLALLVATPIVSVLVGDGHGDFMKFHHPLEPSGVWVVRLTSR